MGPPDETGTPTLIDLDATSDTEVQLRFIDLDNIDNIEDYIPEAKKNHKAKRSRDSPDYAETAGERAKRQRREASKRYYQK